jgi:hypothetical protein
LSLLTGTCNFSLVTIQPTNLPSSKVEYSILYDLHWISNLSPSIYEPALASIVIHDGFVKVGYRFRLEKDSWVLVEISGALPSNTKLILTLMNLFYRELLNERTTSEEGDSSLYSSHPLM